MLKAELVKNLEEAHARTYGYRSSQLLKDACEQRLRELRSAGKPFDYTREMLRVEMNLNLERMHKASDGRVALAPAVVVRERPRSDLPGWLWLCYRALKTYGAVCQCCGRGATRESPIHVDHIKPRSRFPELALSLSNLQILAMIATSARATPIKQTGVDQKPRKKKHD